MYPEEFFHRYGVGDAGHLGARKFVLQVRPALRDWIGQSNGGNLRIGKKLGDYLIAAGFCDVSLSARYECYPSVDFISEYLAKQLDLARMPEHATSIRKWSNSPASMFAQCWVSATGVKS